MQVVRFLIQMTLSIVVPLLVQRFDRRRLTVEQREQGWSTVTWAAALYAFGPFSMCAWVWVTRRKPTYPSFGDKVLAFCWLSFLGLLVALLQLALIGGANVLFGWLVENETPFE